MFLRCTDSFLLKISEYRISGKMIIFQTESDFVGQTNDNLDKTQKRLNEVMQRHGKLDLLFTNLQVRSVKNHEEIILF